MTKNQAPFFFFFLLSVTGHGLLFFLISLQSVRIPLPAPRIQVALIAPAPTSISPQSEATPESTPDEINELNVSDTEAITAPQVTPATNPEADNNSGARLLSSLQAQIPGIVDSQERSPSQATEPSYQNRVNPKLPGGRGLFDQWMGPISPALDRWSNPSGEVNARVTLASGHVVCVEVRAPTTQELFNPWMSIAIPMSRICGRAKPKGVDLTDPWLRNRPK